MLIEFMCKKLWYRLQYNQGQILKKQNLFLVVSYCSMMHINMHEWSINIYYNY
jgi:hypothetical protein